MIPYTYSGAFILRSIVFRVFVLIDCWCGLLVTLVPWGGWFVDGLNFHMPNSADTNFESSYTIMAAFSWILFVI